MADAEKPSPSDYDCADAHEARAALAGDEEGSCRCRACTRVRKHGAVAPRTNEVTRDAR